MAEYINRWVASTTYRDGVGRDSVFSVYITEAEATAYITADGDAAKTATPVGQMFKAADDLSEAFPVRRSVSLERVYDVPPNVADTVLRGNKLAVEFYADARSYIVTIPARNEAAYTQKPESLEVYTSGVQALSVDEFVTAFQAVARSINGGAVVVRRIRVSD